MLEETKKLESQIKSSIFLLKQHIKELESVVQKQQEQITDLNKKVNFINNVLNDDGLATK